jgi:acetyl-CoA acyltransferase
VTETAWICAAKRTPFTRAAKGALAAARPDDLLAGLFRHLLDSLPAAARDAVDDVIVGCGYPEAEQGRNVARAITLAAGLEDRVPAMTLTRMCASSLEATAIACAKVRLGEASLVLVGGVESMSLIPMGGVKPSPNPVWLERRPEIYMAMGATAERVAKRYGIARRDQDEWALRSHRRVADARARGVFAEEIVPTSVPAVDSPSPAPAVAGVSAASVAPVSPGVSAPASGIASVERKLREVREDDALRADSTLEKLAALAPAFDPQGTVTAGNSCPTSDGASALLVASATRAAELGLAPMGRFVSYAVAGVDPALMGVGPVEAVPRALARAGIALGHVDLIELNEAFASQVLACDRELHFDRERLNVNGGGIALGHPTGCSGTRILVTLLNELARVKGRYGIATLCVSGGQGMALLVERL